ncbi:MAG: hypothetical protein ACC661_01515 [Verrucomicrobiales bacterium]
MKPSSFAALFSVLAVLCLVAAIPSCNSQDSGSTPGPEGSSMRDSQGSMSPQKPAENMAPQGSGSR